MGVLFLTILPISAYPLQPLIPKYRDQKREGQRNLAILMGVTGYIIGILWAIIFDIPESLLFIFMVYFLSGIGIVIFNKLIKLRASGHACGVMGPFLILINFIGSKAILGILVIISVFWSSIKMKRHTPLQLILGTMIPVVAFLLSRPILY